MSIYNPPVLHLGVLNPIFNALDFTNTSPLTNLTQAAADARYLKLTGGTETGSVVFSQGLTSSQTVTVPSITLSSNTNAQTTNQVGSLRSFTSAISGGSVQYGSASSPAFNTISLPAGVWVISYYHNITCTASITLSQITHGVTTSSSGVYAQATSQASYVSETIASGNKYISGTYFVRPSATTSYYAPLLITYSTAGTVTINLGISAIRIA
jgi:hypothetical protein